MYVQLLNYSLDVLVVDGGGLSNLTTLTVYILDVSIQAPVITPSEWKQVFVRDDAPIGYDVFTCSATDQDNGT